MAKPRKDSWQYPLRNLNKSMKPVKALAHFLETNQPMFWLQEAIALSERTKRGPELQVEDIPKTVSEELKKPLINLLNDVLIHYEGLRRKRTEAKAKLEAMRQEIPQVERERLNYFCEELKEFSGTYSHVCKWDKEDYTIFHYIQMENEANIADWLDKSSEQKAQIFNHLTDLLERSKRLRAEFQAKFKQEWQEEFRQWEQGYWRSNSHVTLNSPELSERDARSILGVTDAASLPELKSYWRKLVLTHHPDRGGNPEMFKRIQEAYKVLLI